jgi:hypothetical protein
VFCIVACALFAILWVRSYRVADRLHGGFWGRQSLVVAAQEGRLVFLLHEWTGEPGNWRWDVISFPVEDMGRSFPIASIRLYEAAWGFGLIEQPLMAMPISRDDPRRDVEVEHAKETDVLVLRGRGLATLNGSGLIVPLWFCVLLAAMLAAVLQMERLWRYSLRGMLLAITFVAVVFGMIAALDR